MTFVNTYELHFETFYGFRLWKKKYDMGGGPLTPEPLNFETVDIYVRNDIST